MHESTARVSFPAVTQSSKPQFVGDVDLVPQHRRLTIPLTSAQERIWFVDQLEGTNGNQFTQALRLFGALQKDALELAVNRIVDRHEILRTRFIEEEGTPAQCVEPNLRVSLPLEDWSHLSRTTQEEDLAAVLHREWELPFDFASAPLFRLKLVRLSNDEHVFIQTFHYIISDEASQRIFAAELAGLYTAIVSGRNPGLTPLPVQFADFALWEQRFLKLEWFARDLAYWKKQLAELPQMELPQSQPSARDVTTSADIRRRRLNTDELLKVNQLANAHNTTLQVILAAAWLAVYAKVTGRMEQTLACPVELREHSSLEPLIGFFVNLLALRVRVDLANSFANLIQTTRRVTQEAYVHRRLPFGSLVAELGPERNFGTPPICRVELDLHEKESALPALDNLRVDRLRVDKLRVGFDIELASFERDGGLELEWIFKRELFHAEYIEGIADAYVQLLTSAAAAPDVQLLRLMSSPGEAHLGPGPDSSLVVPAALVMDQFERIATTTPDAIAVVCGEQAVTYQELRERSEKLTQTLLNCGIQPEDVIAVSAQRSPELVSMLLAVLKSGAVYLPIAPELPFTRRAEIINDAGPKLLLTTRDVGASFEFPGSTLVLEDSGNGSGDLGSGRRAAGCSAHKPAHPDQAAYVLYTSGSTGKPKGVLMDHMALANKIATINGYINVDASTRYGVTAPISVDPILEQILCPVCGGATSIIVPDAVRADPLAFLDYLKLHNITVLDVTPGLLQQIAAVSHPLQLKNLIVGGEVVEPHTINSIHKTGTVNRLFNFYGPTEACIDATAYEITGQVSGSVPIGEPLPGYRVFVLDQFLQPVNTNAIGELYIAGIGLARGYFNRPALTAERFVACPFLTGSGVRMYRTGDLARWRKDGRLEFMGRADEQVKVRGFRVEPEEVKVALKKLHGIEDALVTTFQVAGQTQLIAYVISQFSEDDLQAVRAEISNHLPQYMVPSALISISSWPLTSGGKIDRQALPPPTRTHSRASIVLPNREEWLLSTIFGEVLGIENVGIEDNFFALGGHSLSAMRLISRVQETIGVKIPIRSVFEIPTVRALARLLRKANFRSAHLVRRSHEIDAPLSYAQQRLWFLDQLEKGNSQYNWPEAWRIEGKLDYEILEQTISTIIARHETLRTHFVLSGNTPIQQVTPAGNIVIPFEDLSSLIDEERHAKLRAAQTQEWEAPFDLSQGPLFRIKLLKFSCHDHVLLLTLHHITWDGWSQDVFMKEVAVLYGAFEAGEGNPLPPLPVQYSDFAAWQRSLDQEALTHQLTYWRQHLAGIPLELDLPKDHARGPVQTFASDVCKMTLAGQELKDLRSFSDSEQATPFMTLLAALSILFASYSGQSDIVIGAPIANRPEPELEEMIGFFVNSLVMRVAVAPEMTFRDVVRAVHRTAIDAYANQDVPFERLVEELAPERKLNRTPLFQVVFAMLNAVTPVHNIGRLRCEQLPVFAQRVRYDLEVHALQNRQHIEFEWIYNCDLFDRWRIEQMCRHFGNLLRSALVNPDLQVGRLSFLDVRDEQLLVDRFGSCERTVSTETWPALFESQVDITPDAIALAFEDQALSYREVNEKANRIAHVLLGLGVGPEQVVCVAMSRTFERILAIIAVLKAGAAYLGLDEHTPAARLDTILADCRPALMLVDSPKRQPSLAKTRVLRLDAAESAYSISSAPATNPTEFELPSKLFTTHPAYVIYTSGSSGKAKGVVVTHQGIASLAGTQRAHLNLRPQARVLQYASLSFDASVWEAIMALLSGSTLVLMRDGISSGPALHDVLWSERITHALLTPTVLRTLGEDINVLLETLVVGGEECSSELVGRWAARARMINAYGPTECTICATMSDALTGQQQPPIGSPIWNACVYLFDRCLELVPVGVPGEVYIAGAGLARSYVGSPTLTATRFVANPFDVRGARMYRTGDLARWRADGNLEFLGRNDRQLKVRGVRIEPGEIEAALVKDDRILDAVAIVSQSISGPRLLAYAVEKPSQLIPESGEDGYVEEWQQLYESTYGQEKVALGDFNIIGWNSSYIDAPITADEMHLWVDATVSQLRELHPRKVLEIGCGTGLLLSRLAPECQDYIGIDFSKTALQQIEAYIASRGDLKHVTLLYGLADDLRMLADESFDLVIINSVVQYFPSVCYLLRALNEAVRVTANHGHVFIGDIRNAALLEAFHTSVQLHKASDATSLHELRQRITRALSNDKELVVHPEFFMKFCRENVWAGRVEMRVKPGQYQNELSRFRYDVVIELGEKEVVRPPDAWIAWDPQKVWQLDAEMLLQEDSGSTLGIRHFSDARVAAILEAVSVLRAGAANVTQLKRLILEPRGEDPNAAMDWARSCGIDISWQGWKEGGFYDLVLNPQWMPSTVLSGSPISAYATYCNAPGRRRQRKQLALSLEKYLRENLPDYMVPSAVTVLPSWPLTAAGKIDTTALPLPDSPDIAEPKGPRTQNEMILCSLFAETLSRSSVGIDESFFALGGDSILSMQLVSRARASGLLISPREIFQHQTVEALAKIAHEAGRARQEPVEDHGPAAPTPIMRWMLEWHGVAKQFSQAQLLQVPAELSLEHLRTMLQIIVDTHEGLRSQFIRSSKNDGWQLDVLPPGELQVDSFLEKLDVSALSDKQQIELAKVRAKKMSQSLDPESGAMIRAIWLDSGPGRRGALLLVIHHLVIDGVSWRILISDFISMWKAITAGTQPTLPRPYTSFRGWSQRLRVEAARRAEADELKFWLPILKGPTVKTFDEPLTSKKDTVRDSRSMTAFLATALVSALIDGVCPKFRVGINDIFITAFVLALARWRSTRSQNPIPVVVVEMEAHGREEVLEDSDLSRTLGWFTSTYPLDFNLEGIDMEEMWRGRAAVGQALKRYKERLHGPPDHGLGYGLLRYLNSTTAAVLAGLPTPDVRFNYLGRFPAAEQTDWSICEDIDIGDDPNMLMTHALMLDVLVLDKRNGASVKSTWSWAPTVVSDADIHLISKAWVHILEGLARHSADSDAGGLSPSDVPLVSITQNEIELLRQRLRQRLGENR